MLRESDQRAWKINLTSEREHFDVDVAILQKKKKKKKYEIGYQIWWEETTSFHPKFSFLLWSYIRNMKDLSRENNKFLLQEETETRTRGNLIPLVAFSHLNATERGYRQPAGPGRGTYVGDKQFLAVIEAGNRRLALRHKVVVVDVVGQQQHLYGWPGERKKRNMRVVRKTEGGPCFLVAFHRTIWGTREYKVKNYVYNGIWKLPHESTARSAVLCRVSHRDVGEVIQQYKTGLPVHQGLARRRNRRMNRKRSPRDLNARTQIRFFP